MRTHGINGYRVVVVDVVDDDEWQVQEALGEAGLVGTDLDPDLDYYLPYGDAWRSDPDLYWSGLDGILTPWLEFRARPADEAVQRSHSLILTQQAMDDSVGRDLASFTEGRLEGRALEGWARMELDEVEARVPLIITKRVIGWQGLCHAYAIANGCAVIAYRGGCGYVYALYRKEVAP